MTKLIPKWVMSAYSQLFKKFDDKPFTSKDIKPLLGKKTPIILHKLNKAGWAEFAGFDPKDERKRFYKLKNPQEAIVNLQEDEDEKPKKTSNKNGRNKKQNNKRKKRKRS